jgi:hypothetical protein
VKRVLFIGDGAHDIGSSDWPTDDPFPAGGVVPRLAAKIADIDRERSQALHWAHPRLARFAANRKTRGYEAKIRAAQLLLERRLLDLEALVCVVDEDNDPDRRDLPTHAHALASDACPIACGVAVRSIEAWTLGARKPLAEILGLSVDELPKPNPESFYASSGKPELRSKDVLKRLAERRGGDARTLREEVADRTDPDDLCRTCPAGFAPFAAALRAAFGPAT